MFKKKPVVRFTTEAEFVDYIPRPYKASHYKPDWYKKMPRKIKGKDEKPFKDSTIRQCPPFLDAMDAGYIIPLVQSICIETVDDQAGVNWHYPPNEHRTINIIEAHSTSQVEGMPFQPAHPCKWLNWWVMQTPKGWSTLFIPPLNRPDDRFECVAGIVDTDRYYEYINFPFYFKRPLEMEIIEAGTPLVQAIPFQRTDWRALKDTFGVNDGRLERTRRLRSLWPSLYRDKLWHRRHKN